MTATLPPRTSGIEVELDRVYREREQLLRAMPCPARSQLLADLFDHEAWLWSSLFECTRSPLTWRAALAAEAYARVSARSWRRHAASEVAADAAAAPTGVAGRNCPLRPSSTSGIHRSATPGATTSAASGLDTGEAWS